MNTHRFWIFLCVLSLSACNIVFFEPPEESGSLNTTSALASVVDSQVESNAASGPVLYTISGTISGSMAFVDLELNSGAESINVANPGSFAFTTKLEDGASYSVEAVGSVNCDLELQSGTVNKANVVLSFTNCNPS